MHVLLCFLDLLSLVKFSVRYAIWLESPLPVFLQVFLAESKYSVGLSIVLLSFETLRHTLWYRRFWRVCVAYCSLAIPHSTVLLGCSSTGTPLMCVSTRISKSPVLVRALPVSERVPVLVRAYARFSTGFAFSARLFGGQSRFDPADNACQNKIERGAP